MAGGGVSVTRYRVTGAVPYLGHQPGEEFEAELSDDQEDRALKRGALKKVRRAPKDDEKEEEEQQDA
jgi:hypothetical protein